MYKSKDGRCCRKEDIFIILLILFCLFWCIWVIYPIAGVVIGDGRLICWLMVETGANVKMGGLNVGL